MKTKHLFFTLAFSSMFVACSQDELVNDVNNVDQEALKNRPVAGVVEFSLNEVDSRFNHAAGGFDNGETIDLYLMDELNGYYDEKDANHKHGFAESKECWKYFPVWQNMYSLVNYVQTRYPFAYDEDGQVWKNDATLLEGNYIAMHPSNDKITNRRDAWHYINPVMSFTNEAGEFDKLGAMDNQFWLGYTPIYRDEDRTGDMTLPLTMQPIMTVAKLKIVNNSLNDTKIDKIVFKDKDGKALPTIAYVKPAYVEEDWRQIEELEKEDIPLTFDGCGPLTCNRLPLNSKYSKELTWSSGAEGRSTARSLVHWATPAERIPYGLEDTKVAYEYVFNFQEDGYMLKGGVPNSKSNVEVYFVLPNDASYTYQPVIYGRVNYDDVWKYGILKANGSDNKIFTLNSIDVTKDTPYVQEVTAQFDNNAFEAVNEVRVSTTEDLMKYLKGFETSYGHQYNFNFDVHVYGTDLAITDEVVKYLDEIAKDMGGNDTNCPINLKFISQDRRTPATVTIDTEMECMKYFSFPAGDVDVTIAKGIHAIEKNVNIEVLLIEEGATLKVVKVNEFKAANLHNEGTVVIEATNCMKSMLNNHAEMELKGATTIYALNNEKNLLISGTVTAGTIFNDNTCVNCGVDTAVLTITGKLTVDTLINKDSVVNNGTLTTTRFTNEGTADMNGAAALNGLSNKGTLNVNSAVTTINGQNDGTINVAAEGEVEVLGNNVLANTGTINVEGELKQQIKNTGIIFVKNYGHVVVNSALNENGLAGIIDITYANADINANAAKDMDVVSEGTHNYFRYDVLDEHTAAELDKSLAARISAENYTLKGKWSDCRIIVRWMPGRTTATEFYGVPESNITHIDINTDLNFKSNKWYPETGFKTLTDVNWAKGYWAEGNDYTPAMIINATVQVDNNATFVVEEGVGAPWNEGDTDVLADKLNVQVNGKFKANNSSKVLNENVSVSGKGEVEIDSKNSEFEWTKWKDVKWTGKY